MTDILERLRVPPGPGLTITQNYRLMVEERAEAAAEIERLTAHVAELSRVLNGIANRSDFAEKVLTALEPKP